MSELATLLRPLLTGALLDASHGTTSEPLRPPVAAALVNDVLARFGDDPALSHVTNAEPWYRSRVTLGALLSAAMPLVVLLLGREVSADQQGDMLDVATAAGTLAGAGLTLYGRWVARRPLGT